MVEMGCPATLPPPMGYSHFAKVTNSSTVYIAGQMARDADGMLVGKGDFRSQVEQVFKNLAFAVEAAGGTMRDIVKLNYFCVASVSPADLVAITDVRDRHIDTTRPPVSTFVMVDRLLRHDWLIEVEAVAAL